MINTYAFLDADEIARAIATSFPVVAGRVMLQQMHDARDRRETFAFETTLAARSYVRFLTEAQQAGYVVHIAFIWLRNVELAKNRVAVRVQRGGHDIPAADIERRYRRGLRNFFELYRPLADRWSLCDNSGRRLVVVARGRRGEEPIVYDLKRFDRIRHAARRD